MPRKRGFGLAKTETVLPGTTGLTDEAPRSPLSPWINIEGALPNLILAALYALAAFRGTTLPFLDRHSLGSLMGIQFLVIHSFPFMMFFALFAQQAQGRGRSCWNGVFWGMFFIYFLFAADMGGLPGVVGFASLTVATYLGYLLRRTSSAALVQLAARWAVSFLFFIICSAATRMPENVDSWPDHGRVLYFGFSYFLLLGVLEATGFYQCKALRTITEHIRRQF